MPVKTSPRQIRETIAKLKEFGQTFGGLKVKDLINGRSPVNGFVIDASIALAWYFDDEATDATRAYVLEIGAPLCFCGVGNQLIAIIVLYTLADIGTLSGCGIVIVGVGVPDLDLIKQGEQDRRLPGCRANPPGGRPCRRPSYTGAALARCCPEARPQPLRVGRKWRLLQARGACESRLIAARTAI